jgi:hypothetical protein
MASLSGTLSQTRVALKELMTLVFDPIVTDTSIRLLTHRAGGRNLTASLRTYCDTRKRIPV